MIITKKTPFTKKEIIGLKQEFGEYIKTVIDIKRKVCSAGANMHYQSEKILLESGSAQPDVWGGGIDLATKTIDYNSFINIRPQDSNTSNEILDKEFRNKYRELSEYFFIEAL